MSARSICPDFSALEVPMDHWSEPFWRAAEEHRLLVPRCGACGTFRWPSGPFCSQCQSQNVEWLPPGQGRIYSFTVLPVRGDGEAAPPQFRIPALVVFDEAPGVRLVSSLVDAPAAAVAIDALVEVDWLAAANTTVPVFRLRGES
ncbi:MAG: hypothetical protein JWQ90_1134 [Hydrocarboniphaga sp.]|uniref:Zn-ribbon domain-containing OB-fold protein n=1 Tax=Hydrocarboniphaga sp. TaxID=2033016 RepID=UPI0026227962|nr:zinc ribbon domain-containing protein [Hydrocarboniphaga sp.]MDB5968684.1 hypothetical protein [Hydrocarboniphaga sp.]